MTILTEYKCLDCGEIFDNRIQAVIHHLETNHQNYQMVGADLRMHIKKC